MSEPTTEHASPPAAQAAARAPAKAKSANAQATDLLEGILRAQNHSASQLEHMSTRMAGRKRVWLDVAIGVALGVVVGVPVVSAVLLAGLLAFGSMVLPAVQAIERNTPEARAQLATDRWDEIVTNYDKMQSYVFEMERVYNRPGDEFDAEQRVLLLESVRTGARLMEAMLTEYDEALRYNNPDAQSRIDTTRRLTAELVEQAEAAVD